MKNTKNQIQKFELNDNELEMCSGGISISDFLYRVIRLFPYDNIQHGIGIGIGIGISKLIFDGVHQIVYEIHRTIAVKKQKAERSNSPY